MTDYIEEMMRMAGVEPDKRFKECKENAKNRGLCTKYPCIECKSSVFYDKYPDFTPQKQLEIIKLIATETEQTIEIDKTGKFYGIETREYPCEIHEDFTQALAQLTIELMKAGELDKEKVKEILQ